MKPHSLTPFAFVLCLLISIDTVSAQKQKPPDGGRIAVVVDERLAALRETPELTGRLVRRVGRGRMVAVRGSRTSSDGIVFYKVNVTSRTRGWIQREAVASASRPDDAARLLSLIKASSEFERIVRARIFLDLFPRSTMRAEVLFLLGDAAEESSTQLSRLAARRIPTDSGELEVSYYLNYTGLDRYNRQRVRFVFDRESRRLRYDGAAWREIVRRYPNSPEAIEAKSRLLKLNF